MHERRDVMNWIWTTTLNPEQNGGHNIVLLDGDRWINARAVASIRAEPMTYLWYSAQKLAYLWIGRPAGAATDR